MLGQGVGVVDLILGVKHPHQGLLQLARALKAILGATRQGLVDDVLQRRGHGGVEVADVWDHG